MTVWLLTTEKKKKCNILLRQTEWLFFNLPIQLFLVVKRSSPFPFVCVGLDHRALWSHSAGSLRAESVLHRSEAYCHCTVRSAPEGGKPQLGWVRQWIQPSFKTCSHKPEQMSTKYHQIKHCRHAGITMQSKSSFINSSLMMLRRSWDRTHSISLRQCSPW